MPPSENEAPVNSGLTQAAVPSAARTEQRIGAYLLKEQVGHGGMGEVFAAVRADGQYEQRVALKLVRSGYDSQLVRERFRTERQILAGLDHPNIARLLDGGTTAEAIPYLVMELVEGIPIDSYCSARRLSIPERVRLFRLVCSAVQYAHQRLVIHRDIKPGNILVTPDGTPKLLDFGIAKMVDPSSGESEPTLLRPITPQFASPEQVRGEAVTTATDVYSLGVVLYLLLTGRSPYSAGDGNSAKLAQAISRAEPEAPSRSGHGELRGDMDAIVLKALRKEPEKRYSSVEQFSEDLRRHLEGLPVFARKGTWSYHAGKFLTRHTSGAAAAAALLLTLLAAIGVTLRETRIAEASQRRAEVRFNDVRKLANSLLFEIGDSIKDVTGATEARRLILQRSLEYLDRLAGESGNDPPLLRELATAYSRIGGIQGNPHKANLGETNAAFDSVRKAIRIREALARKDPDNRSDQIELAVAYLDYAEMQMSAAGDMPAAFAYCKSALAILNREGAAHRDDSRILAESLRGYKRLAFMQVGEGAMGRVGTTSAAIADLQKALSINRRRAQRGAPDADVRKEDATLTAVLGDALLKLGDRPGALEQYRQALDALTSLDPDGKDVINAANALAFKTKISEVLLEQGRFSEAISYLAQAERDAGPLLAADPHNEALLSRLAVLPALRGVGLVASGKGEQGVQSLRSGLTLLETGASRTPVIRTIQSLIHTWIGAGLERQGRVGEALQEYAKSKALIAAVLAGGAKDRRIQVYVVAAANRSAAARARIGQFEVAQREYAESLARLDPLFEANRDDPEVLYAAAETYTGRGTLALRLAERAAARDEKLAQWQTARDWFQKSLDVWSQVSHPGPISTNYQEATLPEEVSRRLTRCDREIASLTGPAH
jgi:tetratricopeptide (TPR) repeat protein